MGKFLLRFLTLLLVFIFLFTIYLSYFGLETSKFDDLIKEKANQVNQNVRLEFNKTKIHLNPSQLNLVVKNGMILLQLSYLALWTVYASVRG